MSALQLDLRPGACSLDGLIVNQPENEVWAQSRSRANARLVFFTFLLTFITSRILVFLIMSRHVPDLYLHVGGTHVHHLNYGIFLLCGVGAYLLFGQPTGNRLRLTAVGYGIGLALTFGLNPFLAQWAKDSSRDPFILLMGTLLLGLVSAIASALPAWNASQLDPMTALRSD